MDKMEEVLKNLAQEVLPDKNIELVSLKESKRGYKFTILIDKPGGITLAECAQANRRLSERMQASGIFSKDYELEVSSPGIDRDLRQINDFIWAIGKLVKIITKNGDWFGKIKSVENRIIVLETDENKLLNLNIDDIKKANLEIRWKS